ncbi:MAG: DUF1552 domain-containing protein [Sandaracinaceae bacterium]|nr:DUF1552 domain-containing protein [Sandaracinaceae bacterium]
MNRRSFLRALGVSALGLPFAGLAGRLASASPSAVPKRLILWPSLNGVRPDLFWPGGGGGSLVTEPFADYLDRATFVRGIGIEGSMNHFAVRSVFTGAPIADYASPDPGVKSLDQVVADHVAATAPTARRSVHLGVIPADAIEFYQLFGRSTFFFDPTPVDYEANPVSAFDRLFGGLGTTPTDPAEPAAPSSDARARAAALALTRAELAELSGRVAGLPLEADKLAQHGEALSRLAGEPMGGGAVMAPTTPPAVCDATRLDSVEALRGELEGNDHAAYRHELFDGLFDAQVDLLARSVTCGLTRVATLQAGSADGNVIVPIDGGYPHHDTSHGDQEVFGRCQRWYAGKFARLLRQLDVPDPLCPDGSTVLDNSCVVWMSECLPSDHSSDEVPCLYVGGAGGSLVTGTQITAAGASNRTLLKTIARAFGVADADTAHYGDAAIRELLA